MKTPQDQLIDIYDVWYQPFWKQFWFQSLLFTLFLGFLLWIVWQLYKKYLQKPVLVDCCAVARKELAALKKVKILEKQDSKAAYFKLSSIIKHYLACKYHLIFTQLTDKEIVKKAEEYVSENELRRLQRVFQSMTLVKFEHETVASEKLNQDISLIEEFIENCTAVNDTKER